MTKPVPEQQYSNHARFHPPFHFVMAPLLVMHFIYTTVQVIRKPSPDRVDAALLAAALVVMGGLTRVNALKAQDRVIRLEERLRYQTVLSPALAARAAVLPEAQIIALRFASDAELANLVEQALSGKFAKPAEIKKGILHWRGDYFRV